MATQIELFDIPSPCRRICVTDNRGYCQGCFRSRDERFNWLKFDNAEKRTVLRLCQQRRQRVVAAILAQRAAQAATLESDTLVQMGLFFEDVSKEGDSAED